MLGQCRAVSAQLSLPTVPASAPCIGVECSSLAVPQSQARYRCPLLPAQRILHSMSCTACPRAHVHTRMRAHAHTQTSPRVIARGACALPQSLHNSLSQWNTPFAACMRTHLHTPRLAHTCRHTHRHMLRLLLQKGLSPPPLSPSGFLVLVDVPLRKILNACQKHARALLAAPTASLPGLLGAVGVALWCTKKSTVATEDDLIP